MLSPTVTGALLYLLARGPAAIREPLLQRLGSDRNASRLISALKWMFALGLGAHVNRFLNDWALNKWLWSSDKTAWVWQQEVGVVTGGSSGFGALITKRLAAKGMKIIVLDVQPLPASLHDCKSAPAEHTCHLLRR